MVCTLAIDPITARWDLGVLHELEFPIVEYEVARSKILEYAAAIGDRNPLHVDPDAAARAGRRDIVAPPTFASVFVTVPIRRAVADPEWTARAGIDPAGILHGEQSFRFHRPIVPNDHLIVQAIVADARTSGERAFLTVATRVDSARGEPVLDSSSTMVLRP